MPPRLMIAACFSFLSVYVWGEEGLGGVTSPWKKVYLDEFDFGAAVSVFAHDFERPSELAERPVTSFLVTYFRVGMEYEEGDDNFAVEIVLTPDPSKKVLETDRNFALRWRGDGGIDGIRMNCMDLETVLSCGGSLRFGGSSWVGGSHLPALKNLATAEVVRFSGFPWRDYAPQETFNDEAFLSFLRTAAKDVLVFNSMSELEFAELAKALPTRNQRQ